MLVVADASPINYLVLIDAVELLPSLYNVVLIPKTVLMELTRSKSPQIVRIWSSNPPGWIRVEESDPARFPLLDLGESAAMALAIDRNADALLVDDLEARRAAESAGLVSVGTLGVLVEAHRKGLIQFELAVESLLKTNFRVTNEVIEAARKRLPR